MDVDHPGGAEGCHAIEHAAQLGGLCADLNGVDAKACRDGEDAVSPLFCDLWRGASVPELRDAVLVISRIDPDVQPETVLEARRHRG